MDKAGLNGIVLPWQHGDTDWEIVDVLESEAKDYRAAGWWDMDLPRDTPKNKICMTRPLPIKDGTLQMKASLDRQGSIAAHFGHANLGYSGYYILYVYVGGKRRKIANSRALFPNEENRFIRQMDKRCEDVCPMRNIGTVAGFERGQEHCLG